MDATNQPGQGPVTGSPSAPASDTGAEAAWSANPAMSALLPGLAAEVEDYLAGGGWDQAPQLFALVATQELLAKQPELADKVDSRAALVSVAQGDLPVENIADALGQISWPDLVAGCALGQEIVVLPPEAQAELEAVMSAADPGEADDVVVQAAANHPDRRTGRLVTAVLRDGTQACVLRVRSADEHADEIVSDPHLAPNMVEALHATLQATPPSPAH